MRDYCDSFEAHSISLVSQVFDHPLIAEEDLVVIVNDWVNMYINYYRQRVTGEKQEQDRALQELQQELRTLANPFLARYRAFLKSLEESNRAVPSS